MELFLEIAEFWRLNGKQQAKSTYFPPIWIRQANLYKMLIELFGLFGDSFRVELSDIDRDIRLKRHRDN